MARKTPVKVYLSKEQIEMVDRIGSLLGEDRSGTLRTSLLSYAKEIGVMEERILRPLGVVSQ